MEVYRRSLWGLIKGVISAPLGAMVAYLIGSIFTKSATILGGIFLVVLLLILYISVFSESIKLVLDDTGVLSYYKMGRLKQRFEMREHLVGYHRKRESGLFGSSDIQLQLLRIGAGQEETHIDVSPLGNRRFERLYERLKALSPEEPEVLSAADNGPELMRAD